MVAFAIQVVSFIEGQTSVLGAGETRKKIPTWPWFPGMSVHWCKREFSNNNTRCEQRSRLQIWSWWRNYIGPVVTQSRTAPTRYRWRNGLSEGRDQSTVPRWPSSEDLVLSQSCSWPPLVLVNHLPKLCFPPIKWGGKITILTDNLCWRSIWSRKWDQHVLLDEEGAVTGILCWEESSVGNCPMDRPREVSRDLAPPAYYPLTTSLLTIVGQALSTPVMRNFSSTLWLLWSNKGRINAYFLIFIFQVLKWVGFSHHPKIPHPPSLFLKNHFELTDLNMSDTF